MALQAEDVLELTSSPLDDLALAHRPSIMRPALVVLRGGCYEHSVLLQLASLPLYPREPLVGQGGRRRLQAFAKGR